MVLTRVIKQQFFYIYICGLSAIIYAWHIYFRFWKWNRSHMEILLPVSILTTYRQLHVILLQPTKFIQIGPPMAELWRHIDFPHGCHGVGNLLNWFPVWWHLALEKAKTIHVQNFAKISTAEILLLSVSGNKRPPFWNFTSGFHFDNFITTGMWFCICRPNFIWIGRSVTELWRHIYFPRWWPRRQKSTSGWDITTFGFCKQTAAILKFYIRFPFWCLHRHENAILHWCTKFCPNRTISGGVMTSWRFSRWRPSVMLDLL